jgi:hypothetical protein
MAYPKGLIPGKGGESLTRRGPAQTMVEQTSSPDPAAGRRKNCQV